MRILLTGPTAVGKTAVAVSLAQQLEADVISSDSRQCYKYLNIGTSTPTEEEQNGILHFNLSVIDPEDKDSAANFRRRAMRYEKEITDRNRFIIYVGGSTLHQRCIIQSFDDIPAADSQNVDQLEKQAANEGIDVLYKKLEKVDPDYASSMDGKNPQRTIRALDVWMQTGQPFSSFHSNDEITPPDDLLVIGLQRDRQALYDRINQRVEQMFDDGLLSEVQSLLNQGYSLDSPGLNTVGYKEAIAFLDGQLTRETMINQIKVKTRRYAKRQLTYFRRWDFINWLNVDEQPASETARNIALELTTATN